jgi:hypothetical protein
VEGDQVLAEEVRFRRMGILRRGAAPGVAEEGAYGENTKRPRESRFPDEKSGWGWNGIRGWMRGHAIFIVFIRKNLKVADESIAAPGNVFNPTAVAEGFAEGPDLRRLAALEDRCVGP